MNMYEKNLKQQKRTWTMAVMAAIVDGTISYDDLKPYEKDFTNGHRWIAYLKK